MCWALSVSRRLLRPGLAGRTGGFQPAEYRRFSASAVSSAPGSLPLEGYRVLDMTRVLAGVRPTTRVTEFQFGD
jgi:succinate--hydroxymethylglutarate CoA-transferase